MMAKKTRIEGAYIRVEVDHGAYIGLKTEKEWFGAARSLEDQIKRHCDGVASTDITVEHESVCEHCGAPWTEDGEYNGGCCARDVEGEQP